MEAKTVLDACVSQAIPEPALDLMLLTKMDPTSIRFAATMDALNASYDARPVPFSVGATHSEAGQNNGSALILSFAKHVARKASPSSARRTPIAAATAATRPLVGRRRMQCWQNWVTCCPR